MCLYLLWLYFIWFCVKKTNKLWVTLTSFLLLFIFRWCKIVLGDVIKKMSLNVFFCIHAKIVVNFPGFLSRVVYNTVSKTLYNVFVWRKYKKKENYVTVLICKKKQIELHLSRTINSFMKNLPSKLFYVHNTLFRRLFFSFFPFVWVCRRKTPREISEEGIKVEN